MVRRLYDRTLALADSPAALYWLALVAFIESSFFPIPPDVLIVPMVLAARQRAWLIAGVCMVASVVGGIAGYGLGYFAFEAIGEPLLRFYGYESQFEAFRQGFNEFGAWVVAFFGVTPFPYKVITITSGATSLDLATFTLASVLSRGVRFFLVAGLLWYFGAPIRAFIEKRLEWIVLVGAILVVGGFIALNYL